MKCIYIKCLVQYDLKTLHCLVWRFLKKLEIELPYEPAIPPLGVHSPEKNCKRHLYPNVHHSTVYNIQDMEAT